jgi:hypothetical protein
MGLAWALEFLSSGKYRWPPASGENPWLLQSCYLGSDVKTNDPSFILPTFIIDSVGQIAQWAGWLSSDHFPVAVYAVMYMVSYDCV